MDNAPVIIKRPKKVVGGAHHGGAWKVAYADFVTAMWAFFMLLWLLSSVTEEQLQGISNYFAPTMASKSQSGAGGMLGGQVIGEGAQTSNTASPSLVQHLPPSTFGAGGEDLTAAAEPEPEQGLSEQEFRERLREREDQRFDKAAAALRQAAQGIPELKQFQGSLLVDNTPDGLRIQLTDQEGIAMFPSGSSAMYGHTRAMLDLIARVVNQLPNRVTVSGHTDATPFQDPSGYGNWELSADRALAARRGLVASGVPEGKIRRVFGASDQEPLDTANPRAPRNRRVTITVLRGADDAAPER